MHAHIAGKLTGRVTKWIVLVFWLIAVGVGGTYGSKLVDVQNNETSSWLPSSAESTQALEKLAPFAAWFQGYEPRSRGADSVLLNASHKLPKRSCLVCGKRSVNRPLKKCFESKIGSFSAE